MTASERRRIELRRSLPLLALLASTALVPIAFLAGKQVARSFDPPAVAASVDAPERPGTGVSGAR